MFYYLQEKSEEDKKTIKEKSTQNSIAQKLKYKILAFNQPLMDFMIFFLSRRYQVSNCLFFLLMIQYRFFF